MEGHIAIIDPDPVLARSISKRLLHLIPQTRISLYSPEDLKCDPTLVLTENVILYDETHTDPDTLQKHTSAIFLPCLIPLQTHGAENRRRITGAELSKKVQDATLGSTAKQNSFTCFAAESPSFAAESPSFVFSPPNDPCSIAARGHMRILISFAERSEREKYASGCAKSLLSSGLRVIRLDLMSGISMSDPFRRRNGSRDTHDNSSSGISELLLLLENVTIQPEELLNFVQLGQDGCYHFGLPLRADDILCCRTDVLVKLLTLLRKLSDSIEENTAVMVVIESLPFYVLRQLCCLPHELHLIMPPQDQSGNMCEWELTDLFASLPPNIMKFFSESRKTGI
jgi:hypothetical protein